MRGIVEEGLLLANRQYTCIEQHYIVILAHTRTLIKMDCIRSIIHRANKNPYIYEKHAF